MLEFLAWFAVGLVALGALAVGRKLLERRGERRRLQAELSELGARPSGLGGLTGVVDEVRWRVSADHEGFDVSTDASPAKISVRPRTPLHGQVVGDPALDELVTVQADPMHALAVATPETRARLLKLARAGGRIGSDGLHWPAPDDLHAAILDAVALVTALEAPEDPVPAVVDRAMADPLPGIRARALLLLMDRHPDRPEVRSFLAHAQAGDDPVLEAVLAVTRTDLDDATRLDDARRLVAVPQIRDEERIALCGIIGARGSGADIEMLGRVLDAATGEVRKAAERALLEIHARDPSADPGRLSIAHPDGGLSLAHSAEAAALSLETDEPAPE